MYVFVCLNIHLDNVKYIGYIEKQITFPLPLVFSGKWTVFDFPYPSDQDNIKNAHFV